MIDTENVDKAVRFIRDRLSRAPEEVWPNVSRSIPSTGAHEDFVEWVAKDDSEAFKKVQARIRKSQGVQAEEISTDWAISTELLRRIGSCGNDVERSALREEVIEALLKECKRQTDLMDEDTPAPLLTSRAPSRL